MIRLLSSSIALSLALCGTAAFSSPVEEMRARPPEQEVIYFVLPDRFENGDTSNDTGGLKGDRLRNGFDPSDKAFYHGGDLKGLTQRLDYIQGLGATAIWVGPIFKNKPVQGPKGQESAAALQLFMANQEGCVGSRLDHAVQAVMFNIISNA